MLLSICVLALGSQIRHALADTFHLRTAYVGHNFLQGFEWETLNDPTNGHVNYVDQATAFQTNLSYASDDKFVMRADSVNLVDPSSRGRNSIRIKSYEAFGNSVIVLDLAHMPSGCSTWPAFWTVSAAGPWPEGGEIDIVEGVNLQTSNLATLHTSPNCAMPAYRAQTGFASSSICDANFNYNQGCVTDFQDPNSFGDVFNQNGGGWYVMSRSPADGIKVWFWSRYDPAVPPEIAAGAQVSSLTPSPGWGTPAAQFPVENCDYRSHFDEHQLVFDLTFCGDWAGSDNIFPYSGCGSGTCKDLVNDHPESFVNAFWEINALRVFTL